MGYIPWGCKESDMTEQSTHTHIYVYIGGFPGGSVVKESACNARDLGSIPGLGRSPEGGRGNLAWKIPMDT